MTTPHEHQRAHVTPDPVNTSGHYSYRDPISPDDPISHGGHGGHGLMMIACCIPMLVIAGVLVATGVVSAGFCSSPCFAR